jgi:hypothetical protein
MRKVSRIFKGQANETGCKSMHQETVRVKRLMLAGAFFSFGETSGDNGSWCRIAPAPKLDDGSRQKTFRAVP